MGYFLNSFTWKRTKNMFIAYLQDSALKVQIPQQTSNMRKASCEYL